LRQSFILAGLGVGAGLIGSLAMSRFIASLLFTVKATDPVTFLMVALSLAAVSIFASLIPARRATKVDPMVALRYE
jgi:putative ABC transport system permease protein